MNKLFFLLISVLSISFSNAQNLGFGTNTPPYKLTVAATGTGIAQINGTVAIGFKTNNLGGWLQTHSNDHLYFATNNSSAQMVISTAGNIGIGIIGGRNGNI